MQDTDSHRSAQIGNGASGAEVGAAQVAEDAKSKRLPGLWLICVLIALTGMFWLSMVFSATPLGIVVSGALALVHFATAVGLWLRVNVARIIVMVLLALCCILLAVQWASDPTDECAVVPAVLFCIGLAIVAYLWLRRRHFKVPGERKRPLWSVSSGVALGVVLLLGMGWIFLLTVDDRPMHFPRLEVERAPVADEANAFVVLQDMMERFPINDDEIDELLRDAWKEDAQGTLEWNEAARVVLRRWGDCLSKVDEMLARPHFAPPGPEGFHEILMMEGQMDRLAYCRRLAAVLSLRSKLYLIEGRPDEAIPAARRMVQLGLMLYGAEEGIITYLTGSAILARGLDEIRKVAPSEAATPGLLLPEIARLELSAELRNAMVGAVQGEFVYAMRMFEALAKPDWHELVEGDEAPSMSWSERLCEEVPLIKLNMTHNLLGGYMENVISQVDHYRPAQAELGSDAESFWSPVAEAGLIHFMRNPAGDIFVQMLRPIYPKILKQHFRRLADARTTQLFLAMRCYHLENGRLPRTLEELTPEYFDEVPVDPFTEGPFCYEPDADPPRIYSVGPDQRPDEPDAEDSDDIVAELDFAAG